MTSESDLLVLHARERHCPLSIIVPVLNEEKTIVETLSSLSTLRKQGVEVVVVDGGSSDDTPRLALPLADRLITAARGRARQMNAGAAESNGSVLLFLHADTRLPSGAHGEVIDGLGRTGRAWGRFDVRIAGRSRMFGMIAAAMNWRSRASGIATGDQAIFVKREAFLAVGGFPEQELMEDIEISSLLKRLSAPLCLRSAVTTSGRRWEKYGIWRTILLMWRLRFLYWLGVPSDKLARAYL